MDLKSSNVHKSFDNRLLTLSVSNSRIKVTYVVNRMLFRAPRARGEHEAGYFSLINFIY